MRSSILLAATLLFPVAAQADDATDAISAAATSAPATGALEITVTNIVDGSGTLYLAVQDSADTWLETDSDAAPFRDVIQPVSSTQNMVIRIEDLPPGQYAVSLFQDLDGDVELDTNFIGFPKEPFGFSAPMGKFGPPKFEDAAVQIAEEDVSMSIELN
ncbi:MAG: hypothetical protein ACI9JM_001836 [Halioglobus sp.]|jgi:uncharacterized protein (DUF2141 family)